MPDALRLALGTLTAFPVPAPRGVTRRTARDAMLLAPLAALLLLALPAALLLLAAPWDRPALQLPGAVVLVALLAVQTRAFHLDGLADTVDGLTASYDRERALTVMRTGDVGPAGAAALVLVLLLQISALAGLLASPSGAVLGALALVSSRLTLTLMCVGGRAARTSGLGETVVGAVPAVAGGPIVVVALGLAGLLTSATDVGLAGGPIVVLAGLVGGLVVRGLATRRLGGLTGDVLGAAVEIACAVSLFAGLLVSLS